MHHAAPPSPPTPQLWQRLRALFARVIAAIGAPALIAALAPRMRAGITAQLALVEILARKLLLAEVAALASTPQRGPRLIETTLKASGLYTFRSSRDARASSVHRNTDKNNSESWSVRFALAIPRDPRAVADRCAPRIRALFGTAPAHSRAIERTPHHRNTNAFLVARRIEALRSMLRDPTPYVLRLARARRIGVSRSREIIQRYAFKAPRRLISDRYDPRLSIDIFACAMRAHDILTDTS